jgi:hypothetical protein
VSRRWRASWPASARAGHRRGSSCAQQLGLFADRLSTHHLYANQLRLYFSTFAYVLLCALRRLGLQDTELHTAQCATIRTRLLKLGAQVRVSVRRV